MNKRIIKSTIPICLYCGRDKYRSYYEYESYYECNCEDSIAVQKIDDEIYRLSMSKPKHKYEIIEQKVIVKVKDEKI